MKNNDGLEALGILFIGLAVLLVVGVVVALIWYMVATAAMEIRYQRYRKQAEKQFDYILKQEGVIDDVESLLRSLYPDVPISQTDYQNMGQFVAGTLFGRKRKEDVA